MFVVVSIATGILTRSRSRGWHAYLTSTLIHLGGVVLASLLTMMPMLTWPRFGIALIVGGVAGFIYEVVVAPAVAEYRFDWTDHLWYTFVPLAGYAAVAAAGGLGLVANAHAILLLAVALVLLLICGVRNAWDLILTFASRDRSPPRDDKR